MTDEAGRSPLRVRAYGSAGKHVIVVHGGPAAAGYMAPVADALADEFRVWEPWQRGSGEEPLTVARHVEDLHDVVARHCAGTCPAIIGHSWGAMLVLAYAAAYPEEVGPLVLLGCGTFDVAAREQMRRAVAERMDAGLRRELDRQAEARTDPDERLRAMGQLVKPLYTYRPLPESGDGQCECDARAHEETWQDMMRMQEKGVYPAAFADIRTPVLMLHGTYDPHPGRMVRDGLLRLMPQLEYVEWEKCGHSPWEEAEVHEKFYETLRRWLRANL